MLTLENAPWYRYYGDMPRSIDYPDKSLFQMIEAAAGQYPDNCAYTFLGSKISYSRFLARIDATARALYALGISAGDRFTICMPNAPQAIDCFYALNRIGAVSNMIHPLSAPSEIAFYLNHSQSVGILVLDQFYEKIRSILPQLKRPVKIVVASVSEELPALKRVGYVLTQGRKLRGMKMEPGIRWKDFLRAGRGKTLPAHRVQSGDGACILYSGGTTGTTKGILLSNRNFNALGLQTIAASGCKRIAGMKMLSVMPLFHGFGLGIGIHTALIGGATCILVPRFSVKTYAELLRKEKPNFVPGVPTLFEALLRAEHMEKTELSFLSGMFSGGDTLSVELKRKVDAFLRAHKAKIQIREGYGTTECVTASCLTPPDYAREGSIGIPFPDTFYEIVKPGTTQPLPPGEEGEICISGPTVMLGYVDNPAETALALQQHDDGRVWLHTGDLGCMDADGFVYFRQRIKRMIVTSGYNVYPSQLENVLDGHAKVQRSCVIGVPDPYRISRVKAYIVPAPGVEPSEALSRELMAYCKEHIAKYALPGSIEFRSELPMTLVGKVDYRKLEAEAREERRV